MPIGDQTIKPSGDLFFFWSWAVPTAKQWRFCPAVNLQYQFLIDGHPYKFQ